MSNQLKMFPATDYKSNVRFDKRTAAAFYQGRGIRTLYFLKFVSSSIIIRGKIESDIVDSLDVVGTKSIEVEKGCKKRRQDRRISMNSKSLSGITIIFIYIKEL